MSPRKAEAAQIIFVDRSFDDLETTCLVSPFLADEKPLKGLNGFVDWRLNGNISRQLLRQRLHGNLIETLLVPTAPRLGVKNILLVGLGPKKEVGEEVYRKFLTHAAKLLSKAKIKDFYYTFNSLLSPIDQAFWLGDFLQAQAEAEDDSTFFQSWRVLTESKYVNSCVEAVQKRFGKVIQAEPWPQTNAKADTRPF